MLKIVTILCLFVSTFCAALLEEDLREQSFLFAVAEASQEDEFIATICRLQLKEFRDAVVAEKKELWALRMLDSSGQQSDGYLFGNTIWLGSFSQCRDISTNHSLITAKEQLFDENIFPPFEVEFMTAVLNHNNTMQYQFRIPTNEFLHLGLCMPKSCTVEETEKYLTHVIEKKNLLMQQNYPVFMNVSGVKSLRADQINWKSDSFVVCAMIVFSVSFLLCLVGTWYDVSYYQSYLKFKKSMTSNETNKDTQILLQPTLAGRILLCYSINTNVKNIFTKSSQSYFSSLPFVHGIKALCMFYIILVHGVLYQNYIGDNAYTAYRMASLFINQFLSNSSYSVDTYFCLGGFLMSYIFYKLQKERQPCNLIQGIKMFGAMIVHRYVRLTPAYAAAIFLTYVLWTKTAQEYPLIHRLRFENDEFTCSQYWWRNLLYISTFYSREEMCISWSWYLSDDMQFYVVNCILLLISTVYLKSVLFILGLLPIISVICGIVTSYIHEYVPTMEEQILQLEIMYDPFLIRMGPYFVGVIAGYYINKWNNSIPLNKDTINKISYLAIAIALLIIHGKYSGDKLSITYIALYMGISRSLWGLCTAWLLMTCISGHAGVVNKFLSLRMWIPISRLTYCLYLTHPMIIMLFGLTTESGNHMSYVFTTQASIGTFAVSFIAALIMTLLFESPYVLLLKLLINPEK